MSKALEVRRETRTQGSTWLGWQHCCLKCHSHLLWEYHQHCTARQTRSTKTLLSNSAACCTYISRCFHFAIRACWPTVCADSWCAECKKCNSGTLSLGSHELGGGSIVLLPYCVIVASVCLAMHRVIIMRLTSTVTVSASGFCSTVTLPCCCFQ